MSGGGWFKCPAAAWPLVVENVPRPWPAEVASADLSWLEDRVRIGAAKRIPGRPWLRARWGWTDHRVRVLLREHFASESPAGRQPVASRSPADQQAKPNNARQIASRSPAGRQPVASESPHARIPKEIRVQSADADPFVCAPPSALDQVWAAYRAERKEAGSTPRKQAPKGWGIAERIKESSADAVILVIEWAHRSPESRARYLRDNKHMSRTLFRSGNFADYRDLSTQWARDGRPKTEARTRGPRQPRRRSTVAELMQLAGHESPRMIDAGDE